MKGTCQHCKSGKMKEVISGGMTQTVHWDGDYIVREEIDYEKNLKHSRFFCDNSMCPNYGKEI